MAEYFKDFIDQLKITPTQKSLIKEELETNWMNDTWLIKIIDAGRISDHSEVEKPMMTSSLTETIVRKVENKLEGKITPLTFLERLFGVKLHRDSLHAVSSTNNNNSDQSLLTYFNTRSLFQVFLYYIENIKKGLSKIYEKKKKKDKEKINKIIFNYFRKNNLSGLCQMMFFVV